MVERCRAVYDIFLSKGVTLKPKKLAKEIHNARIKKSKNIRPERIQKLLLKICREIEISPATVCRWLNVISADPYIIEIEKYLSFIKKIVFSVITTKKKRVYR